MAVPMSPTMMALAQMKSQQSGSDTEENSTTSNTDMATQALDLLKNCVKNGATELKSLVNQLDNVIQEMSDTNSDDMPDESDTTDEEDQ